MRSSTQAVERLNEITEQLRVAQSRIEELEELKTPSPAFVKAKKKEPPEEQEKACKKRDARHNRARPRSTQPRLWSIGLSRAQRVMCVWEA